MQTFHSRLVQITPLHTDSSCNLVPPVLPRRCFPVSQSVYQGSTIKTTTTERIRTCIHISLSLSLSLSENRRLEKLSFSLQFSTKIEINFIVCLQRVEQNVTRVPCAVNFSSPFQEKPRVPANNWRMKNATIPERESRL